MKVLIIGTGLTGLMAAAGLTGLLSENTSHTGEQEKKRLQVELIGDVAEHCDIEPATTSRVLDTLEKNGFIVRKTMEGNRRAGSILITEKGREVVEKWVGHCHEVEASMLTGFTEEETAQFGDFLSRAYKNMSGKEAR